MSRRPETMFDDDENLILPNARPTRADAVENRRLLLDTAAQLFEAQGVADVTMSAIAKAAGVGKGTLYRHFNNKTDLCHALLDQDQRALQDETLRRLRDPVHAPRDLLHWYLDRVVGFVTRNLALLCVIGDSGAPPELEHPAHIWWRQTIFGLLERMQIRGDIDYIADTLYVMIGPGTLRFQIMSQGYDTQRILDGLHTYVDRLN